MEFNMSNWKRIIPFESKQEQIETWLYKDSKQEQKYNVSVFHGKPIDILSLKINECAEFDKKVQEIKTSRTNLFKQNNLEKIEFCPVCNYETKNMQKIITIYGANYYQCPTCSHYFILERPTKESLCEFYSKSTQYQSTYADKKTTQTRLEQVAIPKAKWVIDLFEKKYKRKPKSILDVGAGSGHFVQACKQLGINANGIELSKNGVDFCKENFGFDLINKDFIKNQEEFKDYDIITFWGVIEHVALPNEMINTAIKILKQTNGLLAVEVPRWNCFSTTIQSIFTESIIRHLDPLGHIHCFTDSSLAELFRINNIDIMSAWYFGMDTYELATQLSYMLKENNVVNNLKQCIPDFQQTLDLAKLSDSMVLAGTIKS
jgi:2-polyprenyl-3-methyl-5-hydroxy-6-metoxy-1,4-benzoquinol methylase